MKFDKFQVYMLKLVERSDLGLKFRQGVIYVKFLALPKVANTHQTLVISIPGTHPSDDFHNG